MSTSGAEVVEPIGELLGADRVVATRMVVGEDGCFTGEVAYYAYGPTKAEAVKELARSEGYDLDRCYAYSDSATDLPMLQEVGHPHAVNPDRTLRREALARGWPILDFHRPVRLKQRIPTFSVPPRPALVAAAAQAPRPPPRAWSGTRADAGRRSPELPVHRLPDLVRYTDARLQPI